MTYNIAFRIENYNSSIVFYYKGNSRYAFAIYIAKNPPSTGKATPLIIELRSLNRYTIASITSDTSANITIE